MKQSLLAALTAAQAERRAVSLALRLSDGAAFLLPGDPAPEAVIGEAADMRAADRTGTVEIGDESWFIESRNPPPRLILIGAVHISQPLVQIAAAMGFETIIVDPRRAFATDDRFPGTRLMTDWPDDALDQLRPDGRTAIVTLTHDPKLDDPALERALRSDAFYLGSLGSRKTHASRLQRLAEAGFDETALARIHGPVGLDIAAVTAPEIALSIIAQIVAARRMPARRARAAA
jgi:xanthine dehydrogenase accessory factor